MESGFRYVMRRLLAIVGVVAALILLRILAEPRESPHQTRAVTEDERARLLRSEPAAALSFSDLTKRLAEKRIILVGEQHYINESIGFLLRLLDALPARNLVLCLEIPSSKQPAVDAYLASGDETHFAAIWGAHEALPYHDILRWAFAHRARVRQVVAMDQPQWRITFQRAVLHDSRNADMAEAIATATNTHPDSQVVAYGGQLHMLRGGRYRYDDPSRVPAGARLVTEQHVEPNDIATVLLNNDGYPLAQVWPKEAMVDLHAVGAVAPELLIDYALFRASGADELADYWVSLGPSTKLDFWH